MDEKDDKIETEWRLELDEFVFGGCMSNHVTN